LKEAAECNPSPPKEKLESVLRASEADFAEERSAEVSMEKVEQYYTCGLESLPNQFKYQAR